LNDTKDRCRASGMQYTVGQPFTEKRFEDIGNDVVSGRAGVG
jgi:hypothetical protein